MSESTPTTVLAPLSPADQTRALAAVFTRAEMTRAFEQYLELQRALDELMPDQIIEIADRKFRKKGYWRAVRRGFNVRVVMISETREHDGEFGDGRPNFVYLVVYHASLPDGTEVTGDGACSALEKAGRFKCPHPEREGSTRSLHYPHETCPDYDSEYRWRELPADASIHNVRSHAHTRAFNRAVSNLVGFGEVSAEEVDPDADDPSTSSRPHRASAPRGNASERISIPQQKRMFAISREHGWTDAEVKSLIKAKYGFDHSNEVTRDKYDAVCGDLQLGTEGRSK